MRILHVITSLLTGGAEHLMVDLLPMLQHNGDHTVELLVFNGAKTQFYHEIEEKGIKVHSLSDGGNVYNPVHIIKLFRFVKHYDIIHTHNTACQFYIPIAQSLFCKKAVLVTTEHSSNNRRRTKPWFKPIDRWMYRQYASIICISDKAQSNLTDYIGTNNNICTIYNGVDTKRFFHSVKDIQTRNAYIITMVASLRVEKDHDTVIKAMGHLNSSYSLQIVGSGEQEDRLKSLCEKLGVGNRVSFLGARMDVPDILDKSDIIVLSSHWEGLSLSSIEGMASGRPFIASDVDGLHEMVVGAGVLFPEGNDFELAKKIQYLCEHPNEYRAVALRCQKRARQFDISMMVNNYLELYKKLSTN